MTGTAAACCVGPTCNCPATGGEERRRIGRCLRNNLREQPWSSVDHIDFGRSFLSNSIQLLVNLLLLLTLPLLLTQQDVQLLLLLLAVLQLRLLLNEQLPLSSSCCCN